MSFIYNNAGTKKIVERIIFSPKINYIFARLVNRPMILMFHRVKQSIDNLLDRRTGVCGLEDFEKILIYLKDTGYRFFSLNDLVDMLSNRRHGRFVALTFDDGFKDIYQNVFPILKKYNIPATLFLITSTVNSKSLLWLHKLYFCVESMPVDESKTILQNYSSLDKSNPNINELLSDVIHHCKKSNLNKLISELMSEAKMDKNSEAQIADTLYLSSNELLKLKRHGMQIEPHGHEHWSLNILDKEKTKYEVDKCVKYIRDNFNRKPRFYATSYGRSNPFLDRIVAEQDLECILTCQQRFACHSDMYEICKLPRIGVDQHSMDFSWLLAKYFVAVFREKLDFRNK
jgi:peptidoglycan/xylan/chitin deacetylase (PgdA/CDA1 family)